MASRAAQVVLALAVFSAVGVIMLGPVASVVDANTGTQTITNETVVADYNQSIDLQGYDIDSASETVWGLNDSSGNYEQASSPGDYTLDEGSGEVSFNSSSTLIQEGEEVKVSYTYQAAGPLASLVIGFITLGLGLLIFVGIANRVQGFL